MTIETVAFVGVGNMGAPMARRVKDAGFRVMVCDKSASALSEFAGDKVVIARTASECASADLVIILVGNNSQLLDVATGAEGLVSGIPIGHRPIICVMSTTLPKTIMSLAAPLVEKGARVIDAPVSGGIVRAEEGTLTIMMGGREDDIAEVTPVMQVMGKHLVRCGELGSAEVVKVVNNVLCIAAQFLTAEAIDLAEANGVTFESIAPILDVSTGRNFLTGDAVEARRQYAAWARSEGAYVSLKNVVSKDLHLAKELAEDHGLDLGLLDKLSNHVDGTDDYVMQQWMRHGRHEN